MVEAVMVYQCALCHRATYTTTDVAHDWFHVGEQLSYAEQVVCPLCEIESKMRTERREKEDQERERASRVLFGLPQGAVSGSTQLLEPLDDEPAARDQCPVLHPGGVRLLRSAQEEPPQ